MTPKVAPRKEVRSEVRRPEPEKEKKKPSPVVKSLESGGVKLSEKQRAKLEAAAHEEREYTMREALAAADTAGAQLTAEQRGAGERYADAVAPGAVSKFDDAKPDLVRVVREPAPQDSLYAARAAQSSFETVSPGPLELSGAGRVSVQKAGNAGLASYAAAGPLPGAATAPATAVTAPGGRDSSGLDKRLQKYAQYFSAPSTGLIDPSKVTVGPDGTLTAKPGEKVSASFESYAPERPPITLSTDAKGVVRMSPGYTPGHFIDLKAAGRFVLQEDGALKASTEPLKSKDFVIVPGEGEFFTAKNGLAEGRAKVVGGKAYVPGLGEIDAKTGGKKDLPADAKNYLRLSFNSDGTFRSHQRKNASFLESKEFGIIKTVVKVAANFIPVVGTAISIGLSVVDAAISAAKGQILGAVINLAGAVAGGAGALANVASGAASSASSAITNFATNVGATTLNTVANVARGVAGVAGVAQGVMNRNVGGILGGLAGVAGAGAGFIANGANGLADGASRLAQNLRDTSRGLSVASNVADGIDGVRRGDLLAAAGGFGGAIDEASGFGGGPTISDRAGGLVRRQLGFGQDGPRGVSGGGGRLDRRDGFGTDLDGRPTLDGRPISELSFEERARFGTMTAGLAEDGLPSASARSREQALFDAARLEAQRVGALPGGLTVPDGDLKLIVPGGSAGGISFGGAIVREGSDQVLPDPDRPGFSVVRAESRLTLTGTGDAGLASGGSGVGMTSTVELSVPNGQRADVLDAIKRGELPLSGSTLPPGGRALIDRGSLTRSSSGLASPGTVQGIAGSDIDRLSGSAVEVVRSEDGRTVRLSVGPSAGLRNESGLGVGVGVRRGPLEAGASASLVNESFARDYRLAAAEFDVSTPQGQERLNRALATAVGTGRLPADVGARDVQVTRIDSASQLKGNVTLKAFGLGVDAQVLGLEVGRSSGLTLRTETLPDGSRSAQLNGRFGDLEVSQTRGLARDGTPLGITGAGVVLRDVTPTLESFATGTAARGGGTGDVGISFNRAQAQAASAFAEVQVRSGSRDPLVRRLAEARGDPGLVARAVYATSSARIAADRFAEFIADYRAANRGALPVTFRFSRR